MRSERINTVVVTLLAEIATGFAVYVAWIAAVERDRFLFVGLCAFFVFLSLMALLYWFEALFGGDER